MVAGCANLSAENPGQAESQPTRSNQAESSSTTSPTTQPPGAVGDRFGQCRQLSVESPGKIQSAALTESSGLAASSRSPGVVWAVNDSGNADGLHALSLETGSADGVPFGGDLGFFNLTDVEGRPVETVDVEDLGMLDNVLYVADIGDNNGVRDSVTIHLVTEPENPVAAATNAVVQQTVTFTYPRGPVDAEGFLVDPVTGQLVILDKGLADSATQIYTIDPPFAADQVIEATAAGSFDVGGLPTSAATLTPTALLFPGAVTAADITTDGSLIAIRTYGTVWLYQRAADQTVAQALTGQPCEGGTAREGQGESLAFVPAAETDGGTTVRYLTVSEGEFRPLNSVVVEGTG